MRKFVIILLLIAIGCTVVPPTSPGDCYGFTDGKQVVSANHCLQGPWSWDTSTGLIQAVPDSFRVVNILENSIGVVDEWTQSPIIKCDQYSCEFQVHTGVNGIDGYWGYSQTVDVGASKCVLIKTAGRAGINDPKFANIQNYSIIFLVDSVQVGQSQFHTQGDFDISTAVRLEGEINYTVLIGIDWATPGHNSTVALQAIGLLEVPDEWCKID